MRRMGWTFSMSSLLMWGSVLAAAQAPAFEVASVRQNTTGDAKTFASPGLMPNPLGGRARPEPGPVVMQNMSLREMIATAYEISPSFATLLIAGGPARVLDTRFDVNARRPDGASPSDTLPMLRTLLADRFKLKVHVERRDLPVYALVIAREGQLGPGLRESKVDCNAPGARKAAVDENSKEVCRINVYGFGKPGPGDMTISDVNSISSLLARIQAFLDRPVIDATGLTGNFEWSLSFATRVDSTTAPIIYTALQEQLGIRAERRTAPFDVVVIDSVEMPTPN